MSDTTAAPAPPLVQTGADIVTVKAGSLDGVDGPYRLAVDQSLARTLLPLVADSVGGFSYRLEGAIVDGEKRSFVGISVEASAVADLVWQLASIADRA